MLHADDTSAKRAGCGPVITARPERYANGETMAELAREYDCGEATIWRTLR